MTKYALVLVTILVVVYPTSTAAEELQSRVTLFYSGWQKEDVKLMWDLLSPEIKEHSNFEKYGAKTQLFFEDTKLASFKVRKIIPVSATRAFAETDVVIFIKSEGRQFEIIDRTPWVLSERDKAWYFGGTPRLVK